MIRAKVIGLRSLQNRLGRVVRAQHAGLRPAVADSLADIQREARRNLRQDSNPSHRTGALARSVSVRLDADGLGGSVGTDLPYGRYLEFGTRRMAARPWLQPAFDRLKPRIRRRLVDTVRAANRAAKHGDPGDGGQDDGSVDI